MARFMSWMEQAFVQLGLIAQEQQPLAVRIEPTDRIDARWEAETGQGPLPRDLLRELREHPVGFVEGDEHGLH